MIGTVLSNRYRISAKLGEESPRSSPALTVPSPPGCRSLWVDSGT